MSWTPLFWIKREDFNKHTEELGTFNVHELSIAGVDGVVIYAGECTSGYEELDSILDKHKIIHVILDGHGKGCDHCVEWGDQIYEYDNQGMD